jgi:hypothetical protein
MATAVQLSGLGLMTGALLLGGALILLATRPVVGATITPTVASMLLLAAGLLVASMPAMYAVQADRSGVLGLVGHGLLVVGLLLLVVLSAAPLLHPTVNAPTAEHPLVFGLGIALVLGLLLTGVATLQAGIYPRGAAVLILGAMVGFFFVFFVAEFLPAIAGQLGLAIFSVLLTAGLTWIGFDLRGRG